MPVNSRGQRVNTNKSNQMKAWAKSLRKPKQSTGTGTIGSAGA